MPKGEFYRLCRLVHGWLSALAFIALLFFAMTGILLNHPGWKIGVNPKAEETSFTLTAEERTAVKAARSPGEALAKIAAGKVKLAGALSDADTSDNRVFARLQGVKGSSDIRGDLETGEIDVVVERQGAVSILNGLHRAEHAGAAWRLAVDLIAAVLILMSLVGYVIFLSLRFRLATALALTAASLVLLGGLFALLAS